MESYLQGVSTRRMKKITNLLCGTDFSATTISNLTKTLDEKLNKFRNRDLSDKVFRYLIIDAHYENVRKNHAIVEQANLKIAGVNEDGYREILGVEKKNLESEASWSELFKKLKERGLYGVTYIVSDAHKGIKKAIRRHFTGCIWQRCQVHYIRYLMKLVKKSDRRTLVKAIKYIWESDKIDEAREKVKQVISFYEKRMPKIADYIEETIEETLNVLTLPSNHRRRMCSTNMLERLNQEIKRRTKVVRIFPNENSCLRLVSSVLLEIHEDWISSRRYLNMERQKLDDIEDYEFNFNFVPQIVNT